MGGWLRTSHASALAADATRPPPTPSVAEDPAVIGARLLRATYRVDPPKTPDDVLTQVFGRALQPAGQFAAVLLNRGLVAADITLSWAELGLPRPDGEAMVRDLGARA